MQTEKGIFESLSTSRVLFLCVCVDDDVQNPKSLLVCFCLPRNWSDVLVAINSIKSAGQELMHFKLD